MVTVRIRAAERADVDACIDLFAAVVAEGIWLGAQPPFDRERRREQMIDGLESPTHARLVAVDDTDAVIGHLVLDVAPYGVADLAMFVAAGSRRHGVGTALVAEAIPTARRLGAHKISLQVWPHNGAARRLYRRHGFVEEGRLRRHYRRRDGALWDAVIMGLVLDDDTPGSGLLDDGAGG